MVLRKVILGEAMLPQAQPLSRYHNMAMYDHLIDEMELCETRAWLCDRDIPVKAEIYRVWKDNQSHVRCVLFSDMEPEDEMLMRLTFGL